MLVLSDIAYSEIYFDNNPPPSILQVEGARDIGRRGQFALEDLRHGRLAGRHGGRQRAHVRGAGAGEVLSRLWRLHADPGRGRRGAERPAGLRRRDPRPPTSRGATCWSTPWRRAGWEIPSPPASMFAWAPLPEAFREAGSMLFSKLLIEEAGVAVSPGVGVRRIRRGLCAHRPGRERASHPPGGAQREEILTTVGADSQPRPRRRTCAGAVGSRCRRALCASGSRAWARSAAAC